MGEAGALQLGVALVALFLLYKLFIRLRLSRAKHPSIRGHAKWSRRLAKWVPYYEFDQTRFYNSDHAPADIAARRHAAMQRLKSEVSDRQPETLAYSQSLENSISDVQFTNAYRVPFPYRTQLAEELKSVSILKASKGVQVQDLDGNWRYDLTGSYGVNVFGYDFYKACMNEAQALAGELGPVLGAYHPLIMENVEQLKTISGLDEVSFHMSGTEAVMQAVRLARYHTGRSHLVRLCGAYHGWWDGVQPGVGNQRKTQDVYTLSDLSEHTLKVLNTRKDIACVLINPLQALNPNADAPGDAALLGSSRSASFERETYTRWLQQIRQVCSRRGIVLIFDEVFTGFRLSYRGAQGYFGIQADIVTYGKTLGGGLPVGVVCGKHTLMKRFRDDQPANISFARGTFNSHPYVIAAMNVFLRHVQTDTYQALYATADALWNERAESLNQKLRAAELPVKIANMHSIWTVLYTAPSRYNWMLQFYLRSEGLELSWIGSGRMIMSFNFTDADFQQVAHRFVAAATRMKADGWWWQSPALTHQSIRRQLVKEMLGALLPAGANPDRKVAPDTDRILEEVR
ncbi:MAG: aminotransferase class III-fold pyridoxal phosphate-dependent enzyme [Pseudomonadota bacterium]